MMKRLGLWEEGREKTQRSSAREPQPVRMMGPLAACVDWQRAGRSPNGMNLRAVLGRRQSRDRLVSCPTRDCEAGAFLLAAQKQDEVESRRLDGCAVAVTGGPGYGSEVDDGLLLLLLLLPDRWKSGERPD